MAINEYGLIAQLGARLTGSQEVMSSILIRSTTKQKLSILGSFCFVRNQEGGSNSQERERQCESPEDFQTGSGPSRLNEEAQDGRCDRGADANPP